MSAADNSYVELRDGSEGSILNGRMNMCSSGYGEYQGFSFGHVYGSGLTHVLDNSYVAVYGEESDVIANGQSIVNCHKGSVEAHDSAIIIDEDPNIKNQTYLLGHAQRILRP